VKLPKVGFNAIVLSLWGAGPNKESGNAQLCFKQAKFSPICLLNKRNNKRDLTPQM